MNEPRDAGVGRREFVGVAAAAATVTILKPSVVFGTQANSAIRLGLLGCGGRGRNVMGSFLENTGGVLTAIGDMFQDNLDTGKKALDEVSAKFGKPAVDPSRLFRGPKAYEQLFTSKDIDALYIASPPYFHPAHLEAAIASGKHIYLEKPVAVDVPGCQEGDRARRAGEGQGEPGGGLPDPPRHALRGAREADPRGPDRAARLGAGPLLRLGDQAARLAECQPRGAAPAQLGARQGPLRRHHRRAERPHHRRDQLVAEGPPGEGGRLGRPRRTHGPGRLLEPLQLRLHLPGRRPRRLRLDPVRQGRRGASGCSTSAPRAAPRRATTRRCASPARPPGSSPASGSRRPPTRPPRSPAPSGARSTTPTPTSRRRSSRASRAASSSTRRARARSRRSPASSGRMAAYTGKEVTWDQMMKSKEVWDPKMDWKQFA